MLLPRPNATIESGVEAEQTGLCAILCGRIECIGRIDQADDTVDVYEIAFLPSGPEDGRSHQVQTARDRQLEHLLRA